MKFPINLASQPFHRDRPILFASGVVALLMIASLIVLTSLALAGRHRSADTRRVIARLDQQIESTAAEQARLDALIRRPENAEVLERSLGLNLLLYRKGISWTRLFTDLEKTLPVTVRLIQIRPQVVSESEVYLDMVVAAQAPAPVYEMLADLESSDVFGETKVYSFMPPSQSEPTFRCRVSVNYAQKF
jgi:type IV pilus assembly protein PilN